MEARSRRLGLHRYNIETPSAELFSCRRDQHVVVFCRMKICPTRNAGDWDYMDGNASYMLVFMKLYENLVKCEK